MLYYDQIMSIRLAHRLYTDFQYFLIRFQPLFTWIVLQFLTITRHSFILSLYSVTCKILVFQWSGHGEHILYPHNLQGPHHRWGRFFMIIRIIGIIRIFMIDMTMLVFIIGLIVLFEKVTKIFKDMFPSMDGDVND